MINRSITAYITRTDDEHTSQHVDRVSDVDQYCHTKPNPEGILLPLCVLGVTQRNINSHLCVGLPL